MNQSPRLYALARGAALREARHLAGWTLRQVAIQAETSHSTITKLEGIVGHSIGSDIAERIAGALSIGSDELFTRKCPPTEQIGERTRPATPPTQRYDGSHFRAEAEAWHAYLNRVGAEPLFEWPRKLSAQRASERLKQLPGLGLSPTRLATLARAGQIRHELVTGPGLGRNCTGYLFDERELYEDLQAFERCAEDGCDGPGVCSSGGCPAHSRMLQLRGRPRSVEAIEKTASALSGRPRPDSRVWMLELHRRKRDEGEPLFAADPDLIDVAGVADIYGVETHTVIAHHVPYGHAAPLEQRAPGLGHDRLLFSRADTLARRRSWLTGEDQWARQWLDADFVIRQARTSGRLQLLARRLSVSIDEAEAIERARVKTRRELLLPHRAGAKPTGRPERWAALHARVKVELEEDRVRDLDLGLPDPGPASDYRAAARVAEIDCALHPDEWKSHRILDADDSWTIDPLKYKSAANRVLTALKRLQIGYTESQAA